MNVDLFLPKADYSSEKGSLVTIPMVIGTVFLSRENVLDLEN